MTLRRTASVAGRLRRRTTGGTAHPALPRLIGGISGAVVLALVAAAAVIGVGAAGTNARVSDADAWLAATSRNSLVHVNGTTGQVDGRVALPGPVKGPLEVVQNGTTVLVLDRGTGTVSRIDPAQLTVAAGQPSGNPNLRLVAAGDAAWIVDRQAGTVQPIDPVTLAPTGGPVDLGTRPLGGARADADGVLWVLLPDRGEAVPLGADGPGEHVKAGEPGAPLRLTVAGGRAAVLDSSGGTLVVLSSTGQGLTLRLPSGLTRAAPERLLVPDEQVGSLVPILAPDTGALVVANVESGVVQAVDLEPAAQRDYAQPQVQGSRVYIPDRASGTLLVYDTAAAAFTSPIRVTGVPGRLEVHTRGDRVWVNDDANATAAVIDEEGTVHLIDKYATGAPGSPSATPTATPNATPTATTGADDPSEAGGADTTGPSATPPSGDPDTAAPGTDTPEPPAPRDTPPPGKPSPGPTVTTQPGTDPPNEPPAGTPGGPVEPSPDPSEPHDTATPAPGPTTPAPGPTRTTSGPAPTSAKPTPGTPTSGKPTSGKPTSGTPTTGKPTGGATTPPGKQGPPGRPKAETGTNRITITFAPAAGSNPDRYELEGAPAGSTVVPAKVPAKGPFQFEVRDLACGKDTEYAFVVVAVYGSTRVKSAPSPAVRPCLVPTEPKSVKQDRSNHQVALSWTASAGTGVTYEVAWKGSGAGAPSGKREVSGTSLTVKDLKNGTTYAVTVTAVNAAGRSAAVKLTVDMTPPAKTLKVQHNRNNGVDVGIRNDPTSDAGGRAGAIPDGKNDKITVHCQTKGTTERRADGTGGASAIWDRVTYHGTTGWVTDVYITTSNSGKNQYSPELWQCE